MPKLYAQVHIPIRKDDFVLCMVIGSAMHLNGVTVTIVLTSGNWGGVYLHNFSLVFFLEFMRATTRQNKNKMNHMCTRVV